MLQSLDVLAARRGPGGKLKQSEKNQFYFPVCERLVILAIDQPGIRRIDAGIFPKIIYF
jgi:hypothetical protein